MAPGWTPMVAICEEEKTAATQGFTLDFVL